MLIWLRRILSIAMVLVGLFGIYLLLSNVIKNANDTMQNQRNGAASSSLVSSYISATPFGNPTNIVQKDSQIYFNMQIQRTPGQPCYVRTSWRWVLHLPTGNSVMWNHPDGEFYSGDKNENLAQSVTVPKELIPGQYTLSRLANYKCGDMEDYARSVRNTDLLVQEKDSKKNG